MNRVPSRRSISLSCVLLAFVVSMANTSFPIRIAPASYLQCSMQPPSLNTSEQQLLDEINHLITKKYGDPQEPPCSCARNGSWKRVSNLNLTDTDTQCPSNWTLLETPIRGCRSKYQSGCYSAIFTVGGSMYNKVCGKIIGYQEGTTDAFSVSIPIPKTIEETYVDGLSLTHGPPGSRKHIWTFAAGRFEDGSVYIPVYNCACTNTKYDWEYSIPPFITNNYFCDTGNPGPSYNTRGIIFSNNPLWDGSGCGSHSTCCQFNNPPWFCTSLLQPTTDDLELRICLSENSYNEVIIISSVELYISYD